MQCSAFLRHSPISLKQLYAKLADPCHADSVMQPTIPVAMNRVGVRFDIGDSDHAIAGDSAAELL